MVAAVEKAIRDSDLGLNPQTEGQMIRLRIPEMTEQRRKEMVKVAHKYAEEARIAVRHVRRDGLDLLKKLEKDHAISQDDEKRQAEQVQKATDQAIEEVDKVLAGQGKGDHAGLSRPACTRSLMSGETLLAAKPSPADPATEGSPTHVAIIMDGNGRWAARRGLPRVEGHRRGVEAIRRAVRAAGELGIRYLTLYSFSSENWRRPAQEVADLMGLLKRFVRHDLADLHAANVRVRIIGEREGLVRRTSAACSTKPRT